MNDFTEALKGAGDEILWINLNDNIERLKHFYLKYRSQFLTVEDIYQIFDFFQNESSQFSRWLEENLLCMAHYKCIAVYGNNTYADQLVQKLSQYHMEFVRIRDSNLEWKYDHFVLTGIKKKPEILVICNLLGLYDEKNGNFEHTKVYYEGSEIYYFLLHRFFSKIRKTKPVDIAQNIIPRLQEKGIRVMAIESPNDEVELVKSSKAKRKIKRTNVIPQYAYEAKYRIPQLKKFFRENYNEDFMEEVLNAPQERKNGYWMRADINGKYFNIINGMRLTKGNKKENKNRIIMFGPCWVLGNYVRDDQTIGSYLQELTENYNIENRGSESVDMNFIMRDTTYWENDIVLVVVESGCADLYRKNNIFLYSSIDAFNAVPRLDEAIWDMPLHTNQIVNQFVAAGISEKLHVNNWLTVGDDTGRKFTFDYGNTRLIKLEGWLHNEDLKAYLEEIQSRLGDKLAGSDRTGAIVMNCNPFTNGHKYLINKARQQVDILLVFVVEEDKSLFKFEDRYKLVVEGVKEFENVIVLPGGKFMISSMTMNAYFIKNKLQETNINNADDVELFAAIIAPALHITVRFAGTEPLDNFTDSYNKSMEKILPEYGVKFTEIERYKGRDGEPVSASRVRRCLKNREYDIIKEMVPKTTYRFLEQNYFCKSKEV